jgi:hypothetical protein
VTENVNDLVDEPLGAAVVVGAGAAVEAVVVVGGRAVTGAAVGLGVAMGTADVDAAVDGSVDVVVLLDDVVVEALVVGADDTEIVDNEVVRLVEVATLGPPSAASRR